MKLQERTHSYIYQKVLRFRLNASISTHNLISFGKQFHARGPYTANAGLPKVSCLNFRTFRTRCSLDLMKYHLLFDEMIISWMQGGALPWCPLKTINSVLNSIWFLTGSQWSITNAGVMRSYFLRLKTSLAAVFCLRWSFFYDILW